ncbi:transposase [Pendulispora rubella]|uniref:Transposase n=1 Tax=Pendulispora rubella TaxID=2741070 RepID=A0ABZ2LDL8_9BACT
MANTRKRYTAEFKAKVALEAVRREVTVQELAKLYKLHAVQVFKWKKQFLENAGRAFDASEVPGQREAELLKKIGELTVERDVLARGLRRIR